MTTTHTFTTHTGDGDTVTVTYTHSPAEPMTLEYPGCEAEIEIVSPACGDDRELLEKAWEHYLEQQQ